MKNDIIRTKETRITEVGNAEPQEQKEYATPLWHQIKLVNKRMNLSFWRTPNYGFTRLYNHIILALLTGLAYLVCHAYTHVCSFSFCRGPMYAREIRNNSNRLSCLGGLPRTW